MRDNLIDSIKAFAIILVILGHSIQFNIPENFDSDYLFFPYAFIHVYQRLCNHIFKKAKSKILGTKGKDITPTIFVVGFYQLFHLSLWNVIL